MSEPDSRPAVLVLEDSLLIALAIEAALDDRGFAAIMAGSLAAAQDRLAGQLPSAAILDLGLPDGNSLALARDLHARGCPVAICSGSDSESVPPGHEFAHCFQKPTAGHVLAEWAVQATAPPTPGNIAIR